MTYKISEQKLEKLQQELEELKFKKKDILEQVSEARELGDLSENAEYKAARSEQRQCVGRIEELEHILNNYEIIIKPSSTAAVEVGCTVKLGGEDPKTYQVVGSLEADPAAGLISDESPLGEALMGKKVGDSVTIGLKNYTIEQISV